MILFTGEIVEGGIIGDGQIMIGSSILQPIPANITFTGGHYQLQMVIIL